MGVNNARKKGSNVNIPTKTWKLVEIFSATTFLTFEIPKSHIEINEVFRVETHRIFNMWRQKKKNPYRKTSKFLFYFTSISLTS